MGSKPDYNSLPDVQLTNLLRTGDTMAFTEIYNRYFYLLFTHAYKKLRDESTSEDIVQELFTALWQNRDKAPDGSNLGGYLYTLLRNRILNHFAHLKVESNYANALVDHLSQSRNHNTDHLIREKEFQAYIEKQIQQLPNRMRRVFELSRKDQLSHKEIAVQLNISENNVSKHVNGALKILKTKLPPERFSSLFPFLF